MNNMENKMWTTKMLLDLVLSADLTNLWWYPAKCDNNSPTEDKRIIALLRAFDLCPNDKYESGIAGFSAGMFVLTRPKNDVVEILRELENMLQELCDLSDEKPLIGKRRYYDPNNPNKDKWLLMAVFRELFEYRKDLDYFASYNRKYSRMLLHTDCFGLHLYKTLSLGLLRQLSIKELTLQMQRIDDVLLKIIGEKEPVSEAELIEKYGFPEPSEIDSMSLDELVAQL
ncbi:MAG: hypothetical protein LBR10_02545 [Prevotellaceae bacterium]|nr:hypothetical protein [Prevotellaceae bacterium]